jgi:tRNA G18 (ribose-2'-O)-methylase SpoU
MPVVEVGNLARALEDLRGRGVTVVGLDADAPAEDAPAPTDDPAS